MGRNLREKIQLRPTFLFLSVNGRKRKEGKRVADKIITILLGHI
jgi:hypothetical protein